MKTAWGILAVGLQVAALAYLAGEREWVLQTGRLIYLRTAPVDPRDAMRGDYLRLSYQISRVPWALYRGALAKTNGPGEILRRDTRVYAELRQNPDGVAEVTALSDQRPRDGLFIRGRTEPQGWRGWIPDQSSREDWIAVRYGLEAYFMEQGRAAEFEARRPREGIQMPLEMAVAVSPHGLAVLKGHRWGPLGIGLELELQPAAQTQRPGAPVLRAAKVTLFNAQTNELAIVDLPQGRSLVLVAERRWGKTRWQWVSADAPAPKPEPSHIVVLKPGTSHTMHVDFRDPVWFVRKTDPGPPEKTETTSLADLRADSSVNFRFEYRPPGPEQCAGLPQAPLIWQGRLATRAFGLGGTVD